MYILSGAALLVVFPRPLMVQNLAKKEIPGPLLKDDAAARGDNL